MTHIQKMLRGYTGLRPLDAGESRPNADGTSSTELSTHMPMPGGEWMMAPSLWMGPGGPVELSDEDTIRRMAMEYEQGTGRTFPRWPSMDEALRDPGYRSREGGTAAGPMATFAPYKSPKPEKKNKK